MTRFITEVVDSKLSTETLEEMFKTTRSMIKNCIAHEISPESLWDWERLLARAVSIRRGMNE